VALARPFQSTFPSLGTKCGRRERESRREGRGDVKPLSAISIPSRVVTVEGIPVFGKAALFAGRHRNEGLGRLVVGRRGSSAANERADDRGCPPDAEEGNAVGPRSPSVGAGREAREIVASVTGRVLHSVRRLVHVSSLTGSPSEASRLGKPAQAGGTSTGVVEGGRRAARRASPLRKEKRVVRQKRKVVEATVPARTRSPGLVARTSNERNCRSRQAASGLE